MLRPLRSELYRMTRRLMPRVILGAMFGFGLVFYELIYTTVSQQLGLLRSGNAPSSVTGPGGTEAMIRQLEQTLQQLAPASIPELGVGLVAGLGTVLLIVYGPSHLGTEYGWGTLRTLLASGLSRRAFLATKLVSLLLFTVALTALGVVSVTAASYLVSLQAGFDTGGLDPARILSASWRTGYAFLPYTALTALIALWARSSGAGIAAGLVIFFVEGLATQLLISLNRDLVTVANLGISRNVASLSRLSVSVSGSTPESAGAPLPDQTQAALVLAAWIVAFIALAYWRLRSRDVTLA